MAAGAGWAWLRDGDRVMHITGAGGPRGPLTAIVDRVPVLEAGQVVALDLSRATTWATPAPPQAAPLTQIAAACGVVRPHLWNDPRALALGTEPSGQTVADLVGRGPGLTPAGDDAVAGFALARRAVDPSRAPDLATLVRTASAATGEPSRSLLRAAADGEAFEPVARMLAVLLQADGPAIAPALRRLTALGRTTGRATLTGLVRGLLGTAQADG